MEMTGYLIDKLPDSSSPVDCEISNLIVDNNYEVLRSALSDLNEEKRRDVLNKVDSYGNTCLGLACNNESARGVLDVLIENGAAVNQTDFYGQTPLQYACFAGNVGVIDALIKAGADVNFIEERYSALHTAASKGHVEVLQTLLLAGGNINILTKRGISPLHCAIESGNIDCARTLLERGASVNFVTDSKRKTKTSKCADPLLVRAAGLGNIEAVKVLLDFGAKPNSFSYYGMTALNVSCNRHLNDITTLLLHYGADVNVPDRNGSIPLHYAARHGDVRLVEMILSKDGQKNVLDINGESPLNLAIRSQNIDVVKLLLQHGCDPNLYDPAIRDSHPPVLRATSSFNDPEEFEEVLVALIQNGCDIDNVVSKTNETALYKSLDLRKGGIAKVLLKHNVQTNIECPHGLTILNKACQRNLREVVEVMCRLGVDWDKEDWLVHGGNRTCLTNRELGRTFYETTEPNVPTIFWNKMPLYHLLESHMRRVRCLQSICRYSIRKNIRSKFLESVGRLGLPHPLVTFLMLGDVEL